MTSANAPRRLPPWLLCLLLLTFAIGTDDFVIAGVLPDIAEDLDVTEAAAGQLVTVFSLTYAVAAPLMAVLTARLPRFTVLLTGMLAFAAVNVLAGFAPSYATLMACRVLAALAASAMTPASFATAAALAPPERMGRALGTVATGLTLSVMIGVPVGTWLGGAFGWRSTMFFVAGLALLVSVGLALFLPRLPRPEPLALKARLAPLTSGPVLAGLAAVVPGAAGGMMALIYVAPIAKHLSHTGPSQLAVLIAVIGVAGMAGAALGGRGADRWGPERTVLVALAVQTGATLVLAVVSLVWAGGVPIALLALILACWQIGGWAFNSPFQMRMLRIAGPSGGEALALTTSALYVGIAVAGTTGGAALAGSGASGVLAAGAGFGLLGLLLFALSFRVRGRVRAPATEQDAPASLAADQA